MKFSKHISTCVAIALLASSLQADSIRSNYIKNLPASIKSVENGGTLTAAQAHSDGIGVIIVDDAFDNSVYNTLANKYATGTNKLIEHVLLDSSISAADKALALSLLTDTPDGTPCDDGNVLTFGETYLMGVCQGGVTNGTVCDDGNAATSSDIYTNGVCAGTSAVVPTAKYMTSNGNGTALASYTTASVNAYLDVTAKEAGIALLNGVTGVWDGTYWKPQGDTTKVLSGDFLVQIPLVDVGGIAGNGLVYTNASGVFASIYQIDTQFGVTAWSTAEMNSVNPRGNMTNICESRGMLLPRLDETTYIINPWGGLTYVPAGGAMGSVNGVPPHPSGWTWTATSFTATSNNYWKWGGLLSNASFGFFVVDYVRCVR